MNEATDLPSYAVRLRKAREAANLTQDELAKRIGCTQAFVSYVEGGRRRPSWGRAVKLSELFNLPTVGFLAE